MMVFLSMMKYYRHRLMSSLTFFLVLLETSFPEGEGGSHSKSNSNHVYTLTYDV